MITIYKNMSINQIIYGLDDEDNNDDDDWILLELLWFNGLVEDFKVGLDIIN